MYGNNIGGPFMMPNNMSYGPMMRGAPMMGSSMMNGASMMGGARGGGLSSLLGLGRGARGLAGARSLNFTGLLSNASKALGVVNQAIPIVKEVGPMMNNMRSMLKIASIFKDETDTNTKNTTNVDKTNTESPKSTKENSTNITSTTINNTSANNEPNFFL